MPENQPTRKIPDQMIRQARGQARGLLVQIMEALDVLESNASTEEQLTRATTSIRVLSETSSRLPPLQEFDPSWFRGRVVDEENLEKVVLALKDVEEEKKNELAQAVLKLTYRVYSKEASDFRRDIAEAIARAVHLLLPLLPAYNPESERTRAAIWPTIQHSLNSYIRALSSTLNLVAFPAPFQASTARNRGREPNEGRAAYLGALDECLRAFGIKDPGHRIANKLFAEALKLTRNAPKQLRGRLEKRARK